MLAAPIPAHAEDSTNFPLNVYNTQPINSQDRSPGSVHGDNRECSGHELSLGGGNWLQFGHSGNLVADLLAPLVLISIVAVVFYAGAFISEAVTDSQNRCPEPSWEKRGPELGWHTSVIADSKSGYNRLGALTGLQFSTGLIQGRTLGLVGEAGYLGVGITSTVRWSYAGS